MIEYFISILQHSGFYRFYPFFNFSDFLACRNCSIPNEVISGS
jgi:hypothetical protein